MSITGSNNLTGHSTSNGTSNSNSLLQQSLVSSVAQGPIPGMPGGEHQQQGQPGGGLFGNGPQHHFPVNGGRRIIAEANPNVNGGGGGSSSSSSSSSSGGHYETKSTT